MLNQSQATSAASGGSGAFGTRIVGMAQALAQWSEIPGGLTCTYFSAAHKAAAAKLRDWMTVAGLDANIDPVGNVTGRYASADPLAKTLIVGSHYDTVVNAGSYDGRLGILTGIVVAEHLCRRGHQLPFHLEVIGFSEEEGVRFGAPYLGSSAIAGRFDESLLEKRDKDGASLAKLLRAENVDLAAVQALARPPQSLRGYLEVHIEQGPVLLQKGLPLGVVTAIAGSARYRVTIDGVAGHAGTVPMTLRRDAAAAAAEIVLAVEQRCSQGGNLVGTVGQLAVPQGAINVIPARCEFSLDVRSGDDAIRDAATNDILDAITQITKRRGVSAKVAPVARHAAVPCAIAMQAALAQAIGRAGIEPFRLPSGAGHDAAMFGGVTDIGMLFVRCGNGGVSHSPRETVTAEDVDTAALVLLDTIANLS